MYQEMIMAASSSSSSSGRYRDSEFSDEESVGGSSGRW